MHEIKCPNCGQVFQVDESGYAQIVKQVRDEEFAADLKKREAELLRAAGRDNKLTGIYNNAVNAMKSASSESSYKAAASMFNTIPGFKDADSLAEQCLERAEVCRKDAVYASARSQMTGNAVSGYEAAIRIFSTVSGWKDADKQIYACQRKIEEIKAKEEADRLESERQAEQRRIAAEKAAKKRKRIIAITAPIVVACIAFLIVLTTVIIPKQKLGKAMSLLDSGDYEAAYALLEEIGNNDAIVSSKYDRAAALINSGDYNTALLLLKGLNYRDSSEKAAECLFLTQKAGLTNVSIGSTIRFGHYEQDNNRYNGKEEIEWIVLAVDGDKALILSKYALDCQWYNSTYTNTTWEECSLRSWLNEAFYNAAFGADHQEMIISSTVSADINPSYSTSPGKSTTDRVFLLSITEVNKYFSSDSARQCQGTAYCYAQGAYKTNKGNCWWWLRSPGLNSKHAALVQGSGSVYNSGITVDGGIIAVRPALWINLGS